jgi:hypothetical protein
VEHKIRIGYQITDRIYWDRQDLFDQTVRARAFIDGEIAAEVERPIRELQHF